MFLLLIYCHLFVYSIYCKKHADSVFFSFCPEIICNVPSSSHALYTSYGPWDLPLSLSAKQRAQRVARSRRDRYLCSLSSTLSIYLSLSLSPLSLSLFHQPAAHPRFSIAFTSSGQAAIPEPALIASIPRLSRYDQKRQGLFHSSPHAESVYFGVRPWFIGIKSADIERRWGHRTEQRASQHYFPVSECLVLV